MIFFHGWPGIGLVWRAQVKAFATEGWHCIAPDMRGYGSSAPSAPEAYALKEIVDDMVELHDQAAAFDTQIFSPWRRVPGSWKLAVVENKQSLV
jgi:pimeloyl-ACP methyl ester carboxylesterase